MTKAYSAAAGTWGALPKFAGAGTQEGTNELTRKPVTPAYVVESRVSLLEALEFTL